MSYTLDDLIALGTPQGSGFGPGSDTKGPENTDGSEEGMFVRGLNGGGSEDIEGEPEGSNDGLSEDVLVGFSLGSDAGVSLGLTLLIVDGASVGVWEYLEGEMDGNNDGLPDVLLVGVSLIIDDGILLGLTLELLDGTSV